MAIELSPDKKASDSRRPESFLALRAKAIPAMTAMSTTTAAATIAAIGIIEGLSFLCSSLIGTFKIGQASEAFLKMLEIGVLGVAEEFNTQTARALPECWQV